MSEQSEHTPFVGDVTHFTLQDFERALQAGVASADIGLRTDEDAEGTRTVHAWQLSNPGSVSVFAIDDVRIGPYQADMIAHTICKSFS